MLLIITRYFTFFLVLGLSCSPILAASITVTPAGSGAFAVLGDGMTGVAGIDITLGYDSSALASPSVTQGGLVSGALFTANTNLPGLVRIAIIKSTPFPGATCGWKSADPCPSARRARTRFTAATSWSIFTKRKCGKFSGNAAVS